VHLGDVLVRFGTLAHTFDYANEMGTTQLGLQLSRITLVVCEISRWCGARECGNWNSFSCM